MDRSVQTPDIRDMGDIWSTHSALDGRDDIADAGHDGGFQRGTVRDGGVSRANAGNRRLQLLEQDLGDL